MLSAGVLFGLAGMSTMTGFGMCIAEARKSSPGDFDKGVLPMEKNMESGASFALKAIRRATFYSAGGVSLICFAVWKTMGVKNMNEFRKKMQEVLPRIPKSTLTNVEEVNWDEVLGLVQK